MVTALHETYGLDPDYQPGRMNAHETYKAKEKSIKFGGTLQSLTDCLV